MTLSGLEEKLKAPTKYLRKRDKINMISYADDFIVTAASEEILRDKVIPLLKEFLQNVGLSLSSTKTKIAHIKDGFDFLGFNVRKYPNEKLLIKPAKPNIKGFLKRVKQIIKRGAALPTEVLIYKLNQQLTGWVNYYRTSVSSSVFSKIDHEIFKALQRWVYKRYARKGKRWIMQKYFILSENGTWRLHCMVTDKIGQRKQVCLKHAVDTKIRRHIKIKSAANPFDPQFRECFERRNQRKNLRPINEFPCATGFPEKPC